MTWIQTFSGRKFSLVDPQPEDVCLDDVIAALGSIVRFNGHCRGQYTVLQHSIHVAECLPVGTAPALKLQALLHDAPEAYYGDITRPQKIVYEQISGGKFAEWTKRIDQVVHSALGIAWPLAPAVKLADCRVLATEARDLMGPPPQPWESLPAPLPYKISVWSPQWVYSRFVERYHEYHGANP